MKYEHIIKKMSLEEKASMMSGKNVWETVDFKKYQIPSIMMSDGPHGIRRQDPSEGDHLGLNKSLPSTCFPTAATVANSWDEELGEEIGKALAIEAMSLGIDVVLGPGLNVKRNPLCGRNFEYFSEDPYLSGKMAAAYIRGIQSYNVSACPKHFAANSQELRRMANNSVIDERTLREIYLTGFEIAVKEGKPKAIMSSYNKINGIYANENKYLLRDILADEWGFDGFVVSDWGGSNNHALGVKNGSHLEMPGTKKAGVKDIIEGIESGVLLEEELDQRVDELLDVVFWLNNKKEKINFDIDKHHELARKAASEGIVLLKNDSVLPLKKKSKIAIIGDFAKTPRYQGAGSSLVNPTKKPESIMDCIDDYDLDVISFSQGYKRNSKTDDKLIKEAIESSKDADVILVFAGLDEINETEGMDREHMRMSEAQENLINALSQTYDNVVVILSCGSAIEMPWRNQVKGIVHGYLAGQSGSKAMLDVLTGELNPSGRLNETYPISYKDCPSYHYYPGKRHNSEYREGLYVGYRYYSSVNKEVAYPFGYGLSYTSFEYSDLNVNDKEVTFTIKNIGDRDGTDIPQLYMSKKSDTVYRPLKELKGFKRVYLKANEEKKITISLDDKAFRYYDVASKRWEIESGNYSIMIGKNVNDIVLEETIDVKGTIDNGCYNKKDIPSYFNAYIHNVNDEEFKILYGKELPKDEWDKELDINDTFGQFYYAKGLLARITYFILKKVLDSKLKKGDPNINVMFVMNMPIRAIEKYAGGMISTKQTYAILEIVNGHSLRGFIHLIKGFFDK